MSTISKTFNWFLLGFLVFLIILFFLIFEKINILETRSELTENYLTNRITNLGKRMDKFEESLALAGQEINSDSYICQNGYVKDNKFYRIDLSKRGFCVSVER